MVALSKAGSRLLRFFPRLVSRAAQCGLRIPITAPGVAIVIWLRLDDGWALHASVDLADSELAETALAFHARDVA